MHFSPVIPQDLSITASPQFKTFTDGFQHPNGFENWTDSVIAYNPATRTITVEPTGTYFYYWLNGLRYRVGTGEISETHADTDGNWFLYFDSSNTLQLSQTPWTLTTDVPIALIYFNTDFDGGGTNGGFVFEERHTSRRNPEEHFFQHNVIGTYWVVSEGGLALSGYAIDSDADADKGFAMSTGLIHDEDIAFTIPEKNEGEYTIFYRTGASGTWTWQDSALPFLTGGTYPYYNQDTGATWQLTEFSVPAPNLFLTMYVVCVPDIDQTTRSYVVMGQTAHTSLANAQAEVFGDLALGSFPFVEVLVAYKLIYKTAVAFSSTGKCVLDVVPEDLRKSTSRATISSSAVSTHNALSGLQGGTAGQYYHLNATEYGYLQNQDQSVLTTSAVEFGQITVGTGGALVYPVAMSIFPLGAGLCQYNETNYDADYVFHGTSNNLLYLDAGNNRVGIGSATPAQKLDVNGSITTNGNVVYTKYVYSVSDDLYLQSDGSIYFDIGDGQNYLFNSGTFNADFAVYGTSGLLLRTDADAGTVKLANDITIASGSIKSDTGAISFDNENLTTTGLTTTNTLSITAPSGGTYKFLDGVYLAIQNQSDGSARINLHTLAADEGDVIGIQMFSKGGVGETTNYSQLQMVFITGGTPYWRIGTTQGGTGTVLPLKLFSTTTYLNQLVLDTNGSVGINNASPSSSYKLDVNGSIQAVSTVNAGSYAVGGSLGATGTFTTVDGKTVTASGGLIVSIV